MDMIEHHNNTHDQDKELVYLFLYNSMVYSNGWTTQSVHKTRKSALDALEEHKKLVKEKWEDDFQTSEERKEHPFGKFEDWRVSAMVLKP